MPDEQTIQTAVRAVLDAAPRGSVVYLFGSAARDQAGPRSDIDLLVVEPGEPDCWQEMVRLRGAIPAVDVSVDVVVMPRKQFDYWRDTPSTLPYVVSTEGQAYEAA